MSKESKDQYMENILARVKKATNDIDLLLIERRELNDAFDRVTGAPSGVDKGEVFGLLSVIGDGIDRRHEACLREIKTIVDTIDAGLVIYGDNPELKNIRDFYVKHLL